MLATDRSGVLVSSDWGSNFSASNRGFAHRQVATLLADSRDRDTVYAGVINDKEFGGVFVSRDGGVRWQQMSSGLEGADIYTLRQNATGDLFAGTNRGVFEYKAIASDYRWKALQVSTALKVTGKGKARKTIKPAAMNFRVNDLDISTDLWLAVGSSGLFTSTDKGKTWAGGSKEGFTDFVAVRRLGSSVIAVARRGVVVSHDGGLTWKRGNVPEYSMADATLDESGHMYFAAREGLFRSIDGGTNWERLNRFPVNNVNSIMWNSERQRLFATSSNAEQMFESSDAGAHWRAMDVGWTLKSLRVSGDHVFAATQFDGVVVRSTGERAGAAFSTGGSQD
jgi:ligand-binding sensor domain-containing protein